MSEDYAGLVKRLREMAEHGGAPSRLATMRAAADAIGTLERELNRANSQVAVAGHQVCQQLLADKQQAQTERDDLADLILACATIEMAPALISAARMYAKGQP